MEASFSFFLSFSPSFFLFSSPKGIRIGEIPAATEPFEIFPAFIKLAAFGREISYKFRLLLALGAQSSEIELRVKTFELSVLFSFSELALAKPFRIELPSLCLCVRVSLSQARARTHTLDISRICLVGVSVLQLLKRFIFY